MSCQCVAGLEFSHEVLLEAAQLTRCMMQPASPLPWSWGVSPSPPPFLGAQECCWASRPTFSSSSSL